MCSPIPINGFNPELKFKPIYTAMKYFSWPDNFSVLNYFDKTAKLA